MITCDICKRPYAKAVEEIKEFKDMFDGKMRVFKFSGNEIDILKSREINHICNYCCIDMSENIKNILNNYINSKRS
jgi:hypothetical protein